MYRLTRAIAAALAIGSLSVHAETWTYHGALQDFGKPANGRYDFRLSLLDASGAKSLAQPITFSNVEVKDGAFTVDVDFGIDLAQSSTLKLLAEVGQQGSGFVALGAPKAIEPKAILAGTCWDTKGNAGTIPATDFIGTTDNNRLVFRVDNEIGLELRPTSKGQPLIASPGTTAIELVTGSVALGSVHSISGEFASITGGRSNSVGFDYAHVGGGHDNNALVRASVVAGGHLNTAGGINSAVLGGEENSASGLDAAVGGGNNNRASGAQSVVVGGQDGLASGLRSTVAGGLFSCAGGDYSWAAGRHAVVRSGTDAGDVACASGSGDANGDEGSFVWADAQLTNFESAGANQFLLRADGGVAVNTNKLGNHPNLRQAELTIRNSTVNGNTDLNLMTTNARGYSLAVVPDVGAAAGSFLIQELNAISTGEPTWTPRLIITPAGVTQVQGGSVGTISDARVKQNIRPIERPLDTLLALHGQRFEYIDPAQAMGATGTRIGFLAQDVQKVLPHWVSATSDGYLSVSTSGFEALTVEALRQLQGEGAALDGAQQREIEALRDRNDSLQQQLDAVLARLSALESARTP